MTIPASRDEFDGTGNGSRAGNASLDAVVDALFDRRLDPQARKELIGSLRRNPVRRREVLATVEAIEQLRRPPHGPDLADAILAETDRRRGFLPRRMRRAVDAGRLAIAASLLLGGLCIAYLQRVYPEAMRLQQVPTPVNNVQEAVVTGSATGQAMLASGVDSLRNALTPATRRSPTEHLRFDQGIGSIESASGGWRGTAGGGHAIVSVDFATDWHRSALVRPYLASQAEEYDGRSRGSVRLISVELVPSGVGPQRCADLP